MVAISTEGLIRRPGQRPCRYCLRVYEIIEFVYRDSECDFHHSLCPTCDSIDCDHPERLERKR